MEKSGLIPVLLNTSFNIRGEPILTKYEIAIRALKKTQLDYIYLNKGYLCKKTDFK
jgi:predicted NodU family carbamoyl transferase